MPSDIYSYKFRMSMKNFRAHFSPPSNVTGNVMNAELYDDGFVEIRFVAEEIDLELDSDSDKSYDDDEWLDYNTDEADEDFIVSDSAPLCYE